MTKPVRITVSIVVVVAIVAVIVGVFGYRFAQFKKMGEDYAAAAANTPPVAVSATTASETVWQSSISAVATLQSNAGILVRAEIDGRVLSIAFASGAKVKAGDILVELDASVENAQLKGLKAQSALARLSVERARELYKGNASAKAELDAAEAAVAQTEAAVEQMNAVIAKKTVRAPFAGRVGIRKVDLGQFLSPGEAVVALEATDPIYADFGVPQQDVTMVRPGMKVRMTTDAFPKREFTGKIESVEPRINDTTRNVRVRAIFTNTDEMLRPGLFARVAVEQPETQKVIVLPTASIVYNPYGNFVYVLREEKVKTKNAEGVETDTGKTRLLAYQEFVELGQTRGSQVAVLKGIKSGDTIVTSGQIKLNHKSPAQIKNDVVPSDNPAPKPEEG